jgi:hypothetical protein
MLSGSAAPPPPGMGIGVTMGAEPGVTVKVWDWITTTLGEGCETTMPSVVTAVGVNCTFAAAGVGGEGEGEGGGGGAALGMVVAEPWGREGGGVMVVAGRIRAVGPIVTGAPLMEVVMGGMLEPKVIDVVPMTTTEVPPPTLLNITGPTPGPGFGGGAGGGGAEPEPSPVEGGGVGCVPVSWSAVAPGAGGVGVTGTTGSSCVCTPPPVGGVGVPPSPSPSPDPGIDTLPVGRNPLGEPSPPSELLGDWTCEGASGASFPAVIGVTGTLEGMYVGGVAVSVTVTRTLGVT